MFLLSRLPKATPQQSKSTPPETKTIETKTVIETQAVIETNPPQQKPSHIPVLIKKPSSTIDSSDVESNYTSSSAQLKTSKLETCAFGPKISRNKSPLNRKQKFRQSKSNSRLSSPSDENDFRHVSRQGKKFRKHTSVENLAYFNPNVNPISDVVKDLIITRKRNDDSDDSSKQSRAFIVLGKNDVQCDRVSTNLYKEQKWMNSWYKPPV